MDGLMMTRPLLVSSLLWRAEHVFGSVMNSSVTADGEVEDFTWRELAVDARRLAAGLEWLGVQTGDRISSLAWNTREYLAAYFGVPALGAVLHTVNHRMSAVHIAATIRAAGSRVLIVDADLFEVLAAVEPELPQVKTLIVIGHGQPDTAIAAVHRWDDLLDSTEPVTSWPELDENSASGICFTSGTTGDPKGVVYSHRSTVLHTLGICMAGGAAINNEDSYLLATNMSHVNGWGVPYACALQGARLILPGAHPSPEDLLRLVTEQRPSWFVGAPTVAAMMRDRFGTASGAYDLSSLSTMWLGGQSPPTDLVAWFVDRGIGTVNGWGMTETSPIATFHHGHETQGRPLPLVEMEVAGPAGEHLPWDGMSTGELRVRAPWVARDYLSADDTSSAFPEGWLATGDVCVFHPDGQLQIRDRFKDLVKSGGEWISSVELEHSLMLHPKVHEAAVIAVPDPTWVERPLAWVVADDDVTDADLRLYLERSFPKFWIPDEFVRADEVPKTSVGKIDKASMRRTQAQRTG
ncbi:MULTISPECIES: long-chain-fatty-acid--CoA ligase [unclassified Aeromicrobium]|uniref:long-chain-fatty-acid--CoA ligase n=1 Tax=unclassified Aeromicrobium TaxID=2633570 RepID=UPI00396AFF1C